MRLARRGPVGHGARRHGGAEVAEEWIPAFAGMTERGGDAPGAWYHGDDWRVRRLSGCRARATVYNASERVRLSRVGG